LNTRVFADTSEATIIRALDGDPVEAEIVDLDGEARYLVPTADLAPETVYLVTDDAGKELSRFETGTSRDDEAPTGELALRLYDSCGTIVDVDASFTNEGAEQGILIEIRDQASGDVVVVLPERSDNATDHRQIRGCIWTDAQSLSLVATAYDLAGNGLSIETGWEARAEEDEAGGCHVAPRPGAPGSSAWPVWALALGAFAGWRARGRSGRR
jgi:hypothetical protein